MKRKIFYDAEFLEDGKTIELISIGMAADDGKVLYLVNSDFDWNKATDWLKENVLPSLNATDSFTFPLEEIKAKILEFIGEEKVELWGYYCAYDHVLLMQLWGPMINKPQQLPMYSHDIKSIQALFAEDLKFSPTKSALNHNALQDAIDIRRWYTNLIYRLGRLL